MLEKIKAGAPLRGHLSAQRRRAGGIRDLEEIEEMRLMNTILFDLGAVLIDWNPRYLYRPLFNGDEAAMERFLAEIVPPLLEPRDRCRQVLRRGGGRARRAISRITPT